MSKVVVPFRVAPDDLECWRSVAASQGISFSALIRESLRNFVPHLAAGAAPGPERERAVVGSVREAGR